MYYSDLNNAEIKTYHKYAKMDGISTCLAMMQNSSLFKIQNLGNDIYKIYPLFYIDKIECQEDNVKILDNKCIIIHETGTTTSNQTYIQFVNNDNTDVYQFDSTNRNNTSSTIPVLTSGDTLSIDAYNNLAQVIRDNVILQNNIKILDGTVHGTFADYLFDIKNVSLVDKGILITNETLENGITVTLLNPVYQYSTYKLILSVATISDVHLDDSDSESYYHTTPLEVTLIPNTPVTIPIENLEENRVILYNGLVSVKHDKIYVQQVGTFTEFYATTNGYILDNTVLHATFYASEGSSGYTVTFKAQKVGSSTITTLGTATTNSSGVAELTINSSNISSAGNYLFYCETLYGAISRTSGPYSYNYYPTEILLDSFSYDGGNLTVTGRVRETIHNTLVPSGSVYLKYNFHQQYLPSSTVSLVNGSFTDTQSTGGFTSAIITASNVTNLPNGYSNPSAVSQQWKKPVDTYIYNESYDLVMMIRNYDVIAQAYLYDNNNNPISGQTLYFKLTYTTDTTYTLNGSGVTNNNGYASCSWSNVPSSISNVSLYVKYEGNPTPNSQGTTYNGCDTNSRLPTSLTKTITQSSATNYTISGNLIASGSSSLLNKQLTITVAQTYHGNTTYNTYTTTTVNGEYSLSFTASSDNVDVSAKVVFEGDSRYKPCVNDYNE